MLVPHLMLALKHTFVKGDSNKKIVLLHVKELPPDCVTTLRKHCDTYKIQHQKGEVLFQIPKSGDVAVKASGSKDAIEQLRRYFVYHLSPDIEHIQDEKMSECFESSVRVLALSLLAHPHDLTAQPL